MGIEIIIIHASRARAEKATQTAKDWLEKAKSPEKIRYVIGMDTSDHTIIHYLSHLEGFPIEVIAHNNKNAIECYNNTAAGLFTDGAIKPDTIIIANSDDFDAPPLHWDEKIIEATKGKSNFVLKTKDGAQPWIVTFPIIDGVWYDEKRYIYYPEYSHLFADTDLTHVADLERKIVFSDILIPQNQEIPKDELKSKSDQTWNFGMKVYLSRCKDKFGLPVRNIFDLTLPYAKPHLNWLKHNL
jgi:hypothetical protein